jgi:hypothetical protein
MSSSAGPVPPPRPVAPLHTDPSGFDAVESLYRRTDGARRASGVRHFQPALRPPEDTDGYGWLYRPAEVTAVPVTSPASSATTSGVAVLTPALLPDPEASRSVSAAGRPRRWPVLLLLTAALLGTALLALLAPGTL